MNSSCYWLLVFLFIFVGNSIDNGLGKTPQMGWNSWNHFKCNVNETLVKKTADKIV